MALANSSDVRLSINGAQTINEDDMYLEKMKEHFLEGKYEAGLSLLYFTVLTKLNKAGLYDLEPWFLSPFHSYFQQMRKNADVIITKLAEKPTLTNDDLVRMTELQNIITISKWAEEHLIIYECFSLNQYYTEVEFEETDLLNDKPGDQFVQILLAFHSSLHVAKIDSDLFIQLVREMLYPLTEFKEKIDSNMNYLVEELDLKEVYRIQKIIYLIEDLCRCFDCICEKDIWLSSLMEAVKNFDVIVTIVPEDFQLARVKELFMHLEEEQQFFEDEYPF